MSKDKDNKGNGGGREPPDPPDEMAKERERREAAGKNWDARLVADLIGLSELTVKRMARKGTIPAVKIGRTWEFPPKKVKAFYDGDPWEPPPRPPSRKKK